MSPTSAGWRIERGDDVGRYLREGWFEFAEQALWWLYLRPGDSVIDWGARRPVQPARKPGRR